MTLLPTIPRRPGFIAHQSGERLAEGAELELPLAGRSAGVPTKKHGHKDSEGSDLPKMHEMPKRGLLLAQDSDNSNQGRDSVGSDLVEDGTVRKTSEVPKNKRGSGLVVGAV